MSAVRGAVAVSTIVSEVLKTGRLLRSADETERIHGTARAWSHAVAGTVAVLLRSREPISPAVLTQICAAAADFGFSTAEQQRVSVPFVNYVMECALSPSSSVVRAFGAAFAADYELAKAKPAVYGFMHALREAKEGTFSPEPFIEVLQQQVVSAAAGKLANQWKISDSDRFVGELLEIRDMVALGVEELCHRVPEFLRAAADSPLFHLYCTRDHARYQASMRSTLTSLSDPVHPADAPPFPESTPMSRQRDARPDAGARAEEESSPLSELLDDVHPKIVLFVVRDDPEETHRYLNFVRKCEEYRLKADTVGMAAAVGLGPVYIGVSDAGRRAGESAMGHAFRTCDFSGPSMRALNDLDEFSAALRLMRMHADRTIAMEELGLAAPDIPYHPALKAYPSGPYPYRGRTWVNPHLVEHESCVLV